jgi:Zn ribbon nucleic-acid-binding protein
MLFVAIRSFIAGQECLVCNADTAVWWYGCQIVVIEDDKSEDKHTEK